MTFRHDPAEIGAPKECRAAIITSFRFNGSGIYVQDGTAACGDTKFEINDQIVGDQIDGHRVQDGLGALISARCLTCPNNSNN